MAGGSPSGTATRAWKTCAQKYAAEEIIGKLAFACNLQPKPAPATPQELARTFDWAKVTKSDILLPEKLF